jgi:hypothetical protein
MAYGSSPAVTAALARRVQIKDYSKQVLANVQLTLKQRVLLATEHLTNRVTENINRPVTKTPMTRKHDTSVSWMGKPTKNGGPIGSQYTLVTDRSKPGEFPKADTTQLKKTTGDMHDVIEESEGVFSGFVGTNLDYGLILETNPRLDRSFLVRTLKEELTRVTEIITGPIK